MRKSLIVLLVCVAIFYAGCSTMLKNQGVTGMAVGLHGACNDSDFGISTSIKGYVNASTGIYVDACLNPSTLIEYSCDGDSLNSTAITCNCKDGACITYNIPSCAFWYGNNASIPDPINPGTNGSWGYVDSCSDNFANRCAVFNGVSMYTCNTTCANGTCSTENCYDSDNGKNYYVAGYAEYWEGNITYGRYTDWCVDTNATFNPVNACYGTNCLLEERYCENSKRQTDSVYCPYGCSKGACVNSTYTPPINSTVNSTTTCFDSDGGKNYALKGFTNSSKGLKVDSCISSSILSEGYCDAGAARLINTSCQYGCLNGACSAYVPPSPSPTPQPSASPTPVLTGSLIVNSTPQNASIVLDGRLSGFTPKTVLNLTVGSHLVIVSKYGYLNASNTTYIVASKTNLLNFRLVPI